MLISTFVFFYLLWNQAPVREPAQDANHLAGSGEQSCPAGGGQNPLPPAQQSPGEDQGDQCAHDESPAGNYSNFISLKIIEDFQGLYYWKDNETTSGICSLTKLSLVYATNVSKVNFIIKSANK